jgi:putative ABC transport system ATP-binding protein
MITLEKIRKEYGATGGAVPAIDDISLTIGRGEYLAIAGPPGSGKTTLFRILGILDAASSGRYFLDGYDVAALADRERARIRKKHFGFLFQGFNLLPGLSALENVMIPMRYAGIPSRKRKERAELLLDEVGLLGRIQDRTAAMEGDERQRVAIARALANNPDLILADEPTGDLPPDKVEGIMAMLESLNAKGVTIVMVTESLELGKRAKRLLSINGGKLA